MSVIVKVFSMGHSVSRLQKNPVMFVRRTPAQHRSDLWWRRDPNYFKATPRRPAPVPDSAPPSN